MLRTVYLVKDGKFKSAEIDCAIADGHCHSKYSSEFIQDNFTKIIGVRESYTKIKKLYKVLKTKGMDFFTVSDHNRIEGALELRKRHPSKSFVNCEYDVLVEPFKPNKKLHKIVHLNCYGLDYARNSGHALSDETVMDLHERLLLEAKRGFKAFIGYCLDNDIGISFNHPAWQSNPNAWISGKELELLVKDAKELSQKSKIALEVNGEQQLENLLVIQLAEMFNMPICSGTDAHMSWRLGDQYTAAWKLVKNEEGEKRVPVETPKEFVDAFKNGRIAIGSRHKLPFDINTPSIEDIVKHQFNGTIKNMQKDTLYGIGHYLNPFSPWSLRKAGFFTAFLGVPALLSYLFGPEYTMPFFLAIETFAFSTFPIGLPAREKNNVADMTRELFREWQLYQAEKATVKLKESKSEKEKKINELLEHAKTLQEEVEILQGEIQSINNFYYNKSYLPKFNRLAGWNKFASKISEFLIGKNTGPKTVSQFTKPVEKE